MKTAQNFGILYLMMTVVQILVCNYCHFSYFVTLSILPVMILFMPLSVSTIPAMFIAFATGIAVDWLSEGIIGLNALSLVPVALVRRLLIQIILGNDHVVRNESISFKKNGASKISLAILVVQAIFLTVYILADGAGTRPLWFNLARFAASLAAGYAISMIVANMLTSSEKK